MARRQAEEALRKTLRPDKSFVLPTKLTSISRNILVDTDPYFGPIYALQYNCFGDSLVAGYANGAIQMFNPETGRVVKQLRQSRHGGFPIMCMRYHPKMANILYASSSEGYVYSYNVDQETPSETTVVTESKNEINCFDFNFSGFEYATGGKDLSIRVYDTKTNQLIRTYEGLNVASPPSSMSVERNTMRVFALKFHPEYDDIFVTGGWDNTVKIWDKRSNTGVARCISGPHVCGDSLDLKGYEVLTGSWVAKNALQIWNYTEGKLIKNVEFRAPDGAFLYCAQFASTNNPIVLAGGSGTNSTQIINADTQDLVGEVKMEHPVQAMDCTLGGKQFACGGGANKISLCSMT